LYLESILWPSRAVRFDKVDGMAVAHEGQNEDSQAKNLEGAQLGCYLAWVAAQQLDNDPESL
jgi:hypothetical protein